MDLKRPIPASHVAEILIAVGLILWRIWAVPVAGLWRDWVLLLSLLWMVEVLSPPGRTKTCVAIGAMAGLMVLYGWGHVPRVLALLGSTT